MTIFIASTRAKKLKKLRNLATNIINEYGYRYFIRVAFYEFRRQKFKLFFPDPENKITLEQTMHIDEVRKYEKFNNMFEVTVDFVSEIISCVKDQNKKVISGNPDKIKKVLNYCPKTELSHSNMVVVLPKIIHLHHPNY